MARSLREPLTLVREAARALGPPPPSLVALALSALVGPLALVPALLTLLLIPRGLVASGAGGLRGPVRGGRTGRGSLRIIGGKELLAAFGVLAPPSATFPGGTLFPGGARGLPAFGRGLGSWGIHIGKGQTRTILRRPFGPRFIGPMMGPGAIISHGDVTISPETGYGQPGGASMRRGQPRLRITFPDWPETMASKPFWKSSKLNLWVMMGVMSRPERIIASILYQVSKISRP